MSRQQKLGILLLIALIFVFSLFAFRWIKHRMEYAITDAVFVKAEELTNLGFMVSGRVIGMYKMSGDTVKKGELLALIDPEDYRLKLQEIENRIESLKAQKQMLEVQRSRLGGELGSSLGASEYSLKGVRQKVEALKYQLSQVETNLEQARKDLERYENLYRHGLVPARTLEEYQTRYKVLKDQKESILRDIRSLEQEEGRALEGVYASKSKLLQLKELSYQIESLDKEIASLEKQRDLLKRQLEYTELRSPFDGFVAKKYVSVGDVVQAGKPVYALVNPKSMYVEVLLEETKLKGVKVGNKAYVKLDAYPNITFVGVVEAISPASAATFALVPRDVSAGEFTKVVQRIPVKIRIVEGPVELLRVGMGGEVEIERK
ncbi:HlyD family efflux transporter periplasmic adaptor subunit [Thermocrinis minervae]|uniref:Membrane fusion protein, multidrug efflux system n=1 Tax=Thermocrinis minervae TaxID=381751 RepID=A0A1M6THU9_9AQUI|nr:HlyD family efflux transporter periplasmic adaptor subunit [Thermocrinis minervae]SHK56510.1 membrane fusion protein, multidrug efflux system [Thermocrinis minervae]